MIGDSKRDERRMERFLEEVAELSAEEWLTVAQRYRKHEALIDAAADKAFDLSVTIAYDRAKEGGDPTKAHRKEVWKRANQRADQITKALPEAVKVRSSTFPLRTLATEATRGAQWALVVWDELTRTKQGGRMATRMLGPFKGLVSSPLIGSGSGAK